VNSEAPPAALLSTASGRDVIVYCN
jgi:hypothetical protein